MASADVGTCVSGMTECLSLESVIEEAAAVSHPFITVATYILFVFMFRALYRLHASLWVSNHSHEVEDIVRKIENGTHTIETLCPDERLKKSFAERYNGCIDALIPVCEAAGEKWLTLVYVVLVQYHRLCVHVTVSYERVCHGCAWSYYHWHMLAARLPSFGRRAQQTNSEQTHTEHAPSKPTKMKKTVQAQPASGRSVQFSFMPLITTLAKIAGVCAQAVDVVLRFGSLLLGFVYHVFVGFGEDVFVDMHMNEHLNKFNQLNLVNQMDVIDVEVSPRTMDSINSQQTPRNHAMFNSSNNHLDVNSNMSVHGNASNAEGVIGTDGDEFNCQAQENNRSSPVIMNKPAASNSSPSKLVSLLKKPAKFLSFRLTKKLNTSSSTVATSISTGSSYEEGSMHEHQVNTPQTVPCTPGLSSPFSPSTQSSQGSLSPPQPLTPSASSRARSMLNATSLSFHSPVISNKRMNSKDSISSGSSGNNKNGDNNSSVGSGGAPVVGKEGCTPSASCVLC
jgi:hypothetical protein